MKNFKNLKRNLFASFKIKTFLFIVIFSFIQPKYIAAKELVNDDFQVWTLVTVMGTFKYPFKYWLENQERFGDDATRLSQVLWRPGLGYMLTKDLSIWVGYAWFSSTYPNTFRYIVENRSWEQLLWNTKWDTNKIIVRTRLEQRFINDNTKMAWRVRQLEKIEIPLKGKFCLLATDELFLYLNDFTNNGREGFDQNRALMGIGYRPRKEVLFEIGYMNQYVRRIELPNFTGNNLYISLLLNLD